jgi:hypothetical protein
MNDIYKLKLHETMSIGGGEILRVTGGWVYITFSVEGSATSTFVPWHNEFQGATND